MIIFTESRVWFVNGTRHERLLDTICEERCGSLAGSAGMAMAPRETSRSAVAQADTHRKVECTFLMIIITTRR